MAPLAGGYEQLLNWPSFQVDMRNTLQQVLVLVLAALL
jgi:hypothetical protein